jgi:predicted transposase YdaD
MPKPYDATLKELLEIAPYDWPNLTGLTPERVDVIDADVSTVTAAADKVLRLHGPSQSLMAVEFQSWADGSLPARLHMYNAILEHRHELPVRSVAVLLTPQADHSNLTGLHVSCCEKEEPHLEFRYRVLRLWQVPVERMLAGGLAMLALAPISSARREELPRVIERVAEGLRRGADALLRGKLWTAIYVAMGLRYERGLVNQLLRGVHEMEESVTYQAIIEKGVEKGRRQGREEGLKAGLLAFGRNRFGEPDPQVLTVLENLHDEAELDRLIATFESATSWRALFGLPAVRPRTRRRKANS